MDGPDSVSHRSCKQHPIVSTLDVVADPVIPVKPTGLLKRASIRLRAFLRSVEVRPDYL